MRGFGWSAAARIGLAACVVLATTGCGNLTIRTWIKVVEDQSTGSVEVGPLGVLPVERIQGGFLSTVQIDTTQILDQPLQGTIVLEDVRIAANQPDLLGPLCVWGDPLATSGGTVTLDLSGGASAADVTLNLLATTQLSEGIGQPPLALSEDATFPLSGVTLDALLAGAEDGSADGLFSTTAAFQGSAEVLGIPAQFDLDLAVTNEATPPLFDADLLSFCGAHFREQGGDLFYGLNAKSSYLRADDGDRPADPLVIPLAEVGAAPGDVLRLASVGTYSDETILKDGSQTKLGAVFSASDVILDRTERYRVADAIDAGSDFGTGYHLRCFLFFCTKLRTDIAEDFRVDPGVDVVVPAGASHLVVAPVSRELEWEDDSGFGFGVSVEVNP